MDLPLAIDPGSPVARHRQVYDALRSAILAGRLQPGERVATTRSLAASLCVSRATVEQAYEQLRAEGYVLGRAGSGTYVAPDLPAQGVSPPGQTEAEPERPPAPGLSRWGERISAPEYQALSAPHVSERYDYDLRPHAVAQDSFPWDAWYSAVERALQSGRSHLMAPPPAAGLPELREAVADHVGRYRSVQCSADSIVVVNGSLQGLNLLAQVLLDEGDHVTLEDPGYPAARLAFEARGVRVGRVPVDGAGMVVDALGSLPAPRLVHVTASHQEPTGATLSLARRLALLDRAERAGFHILEDDYDSEFRYEGRPVESLQGLDRSGLVVYAGTFSKSVLASLRIGFVVLPQRLVRTLVTAKSLWDTGTPMLDQIALAEFMRSGDFERHIRRMRRVYRLRRDALVAALREEFGERAHIGERHGGLNVLVSFDVGLQSNEIVLRADAAGIALRSAASYFANPPSLPTFLLGFGGSDQATLVAAVRRLAAELGLPESTSVMSV